MLEIDRRSSSPAMERLLTPVHRWIWRNPERRVQKLLRFSETETDGGRDLLRAAELTTDPLLRRLYLLHATDEQRHGLLFRRRAAALLQAKAARDADGGSAEWIPAASHGLDDLDVGRESDETMLAFLHVAETSAARRFTVYREVLHSDPGTQSVFDDILHDEIFHMNYTLTQLARVSPERHRGRLWRARFTRLWKGYLRVASGIAGLIGGAILTVQYFVVLPAFAWLAKRAMRKEPQGWTAIAPQRSDSMRRQY
ncbi:MAG TPA: ferritin-like domain-containing protein [Thermoanaerobaculia bacterium]